jgi:hypothetical protein
LSATHQSKKISNSNNTFGPSAWSFDMIDGSEKRWSPIRYRVSEDLLVTVSEWVLGPESLLFLRHAKLLGICC